MHFLFVFLSRIRTVKSPKRHKKSRIPSWRHFSVEVSSDSWMRPFGKKFACWVNGWEWFRTLKEEGIDFKRCGLFRYFFSSVCLDFFSFCFDRFLFYVCVSFSPWKSNNFPFLCFLQIVESAKFSHECQTSSQAFK